MNTHLAFDLWNSGTCTVWRFVFIAWSWWYPRMLLLLLLSWGAPDLTPQTQVLPFTFLWGQLIFLCISSVLTFLTGQYYYVLLPIIHYNYCHPLNKIQQWYVICTVDVSVFHELVRNSPAFCTFTHQQNPFHPSAEHNPCLFYLIWICPRKTLLVQRNP